MKWRKLGRIFCPDKNYNWMYSYASNPLVLYLQSNIYRIYFSTRDIHQRSSIGFIEINIKSPKKILKISNKPVLTAGELGAFDDSGVTSSCIIKRNNLIYLYYVGWNLGVTVPFRNSIGLAVSDNGGYTFKRLYKGPILDRTNKEPYFVTTPYVIVEKNISKMWYASCVKWELYKNKPKHYYNIRYAESNNGILWENRGKIAIDFKYKNEYVVCAPYVTKENEIYKMWYSYRGGHIADTYRIGYAQSKDGLEWIRKDKIVGIDVSNSGWDSEMIEYPCIFYHNGERYMLYNGDHYGKTGFGIAVLEEDLKA